MAYMLSRARFGDEVAKSEEEEVPEDYFASIHVHCYARSKDKNIP